MNPSFSWTTWEISRIFDLAHAVRQNQLSSSASDLLESHISTESEKIRRGVRTAIEIKMMGLPKGLESIAPLPIKDAMIILASYENWNLNPEKSIRVAERCREDLDRKYNTNDIDESDIIAATILSDYDALQLTKRLCELNMDASFNTSLYNYKTGISKALNNWAQKRIANQSTIENSPQKHNTYGISLGRLFNQTTKCSIENAIFGKIGIPKFVFLIIKTIFDLWIQKYPGYQGTDR